ncbi:MAG: glycosyltransferase [Chromatiales bacterium]|jgi:L-malate glycosyltransferase|nr:glycosyltransferase [Chromatiales bacterium]
MSCNVPKYDSLQVIGSRPSGGAERFYVRLVQSLTASGHRTLAVNQPDSAVGEELDAHCPQAKLRMRGVWDVLARRRLAQLAKQSTAPIVQTFMGRATRLYRAGRRGPVHVARLGGFYDLSGYRHAHAWIGNTRGICDHLVKGGMDPARVYYIGNFVEPVTSTDKAASRSTFNIASDDIVIGFVGRLHPNKGVKDLLSALAEIPHDIQSQSVRLVIAGDGPLRPALEAFSASLNLNDRVTWAGWLSDPSSVYAASDIVVCPSVHEPLGNVILEAWSHAKPVIATRSQGPLELILHETNGLLTDIGNPSMMATTLRHLLGQSEVDRLALGAAGLHTLQTQFSAKAITDSYLSVYAELLRQ